MKKSLPLICALSLGLSVACSSKNKSENMDRDIYRDSNSPVQMHEANAKDEAAHDASHKAAEFSQDHSAHKVTADSQMKGSDSDVEVTRKIRERLTSMEDISMKAQNITIVTHGNDVTLKGEVEKKEEISKIMNVTNEYASGKNISNELRVQQ